MTTTHTPTPTSTDQAHTTTGQRVELAHYDTDTGEARRLVGQRIDGIVHIFDEPTTDEQPSYLVEQGLTTNSELHSLIDDYLAKATQLGYPPMHGWF